MTDLARTTATPPDFANSLAVTSATLTDWGVFVTPWAYSSPAPGHPRRTVAFDVFGWVGTKTAIYGHYVLDGKLVHTVRIGVPQGSCGDVLKHMREFPFRPVPAETYRIQFDATAAYHTLGLEYSSYYKRVRVAPKEAIR